MLSEELIAIVVVQIDIQKERHCLTRLSNIKRR